MSEATFTPGPWESSASGGTGRRWNIYGHNGIHQVLVAQINVAASSAEREANASLVAAAPDLLAACEWLLRTGHRQPCYCVQCEDARAAVARAKNQTPQSSPDPSKVKELP